MSFISLIFHHRHLFVSEPRHWQIHHQCIRCQYIRCCSSGPHGIAPANVKRRAPSQRGGQQQRINRESTAVQSPLFHDSAHRRKLNGQRRSQASQPNRTLPCDTFGGFLRWNASSYETCQPAPFFLQRLRQPSTRRGNRIKPLDTSAVSKLPQRQRHCKHQPGGHARPRLEPQPISGHRTVLSRRCDTTRMYTTQVKGM